jgi:hypothetical protein
MGRTISVRILVLAEKSCSLRDYMSVERVGFFVVIYTINLIPQEMIS